MSPAALPVRGTARTLTARAGRWWTMVRLLCHAGSAPLAGAVVVNLLLGIAPLVFVVATSLLLGHLPALAHGRSGWTALRTPLVVAAAAFAVTQILSPLRNALGEIAARAVDGYCMLRLMRCASVTAPISVLEQPSALDLLSGARNAFERTDITPGDAAAGVLALLARYTQLVCAAALVAVTLNLQAGVLIGLTALAIRFGRRGSLGRFGIVRRDLDGHRRKMSYLRQLGLGSGAAKEIRVLGLLPWLRDRHAVDTWGFLRPFWAARRRILFRPFVLFAAVGMAGASGTLLLLARGVSRGEVSLTDVSLVLQAVTLLIRFGVYFPESDTQTEYGLDAYVRMTLFEQDAAAAESAPESPAAAPTAAPRRSIRFDSVGFGYPGGTRPVLRDVSLELPVNESTAIVGLNGAGKTTMIKLLSGLYRPCQGRILADGRDLRDIDTGAWQRRLAVIFQDFVHYELSAADNIAMGAPWCRPDRGMIVAAAVRAGAHEFISALRDGYDTVLSPQYENGQNLSGGQWQRLALARAYVAVAAGAGVLILDEPTAAMDARAEVAFYDDFLHLTEGLTTVIISHRFSTVRRARHIAVLSDGTITEQGTHDELVTAGGTYAELFRRQAERFQEPPPPATRARSAS